MSSYTTDLTCLNEQCNWVWVKKINMKGYQDCKTQILDIIGLLGVQNWNKQAFKQNLQMEIEQCIWILGIFYFIVLLSLWFDALVSRNNVILIYHGTHIRGILNIPKFKVVFHKSPAVKRYNSALCYYQILTTEDKVNCLAAFCTAAVLSMKHLFFWNTCCLSTFELSPAQYKATHSDFHFLNQKTACPGHIIW